MLFTINRYLLQVLISIGLTLISGQFSKSGDQWFSNITCNNTRDCDVIHFGATCLPRVEVIDGFNVSVTRCFCNNEHKYYRMNETCVYSADVGDTCDNVTSICSDTNAICNQDGDGYGINRCLCRDGSRLVNSQGQIICAYELTVDMDSDCVNCVMNHGICFDLSGNGSKDGCHCPSTLSGQDCSTSHVNVTCDIDSIHVCYLPHPHVDMAGEAWLHVTNYGHKVACAAALRPDICGKGQYYMHLSTTDALRHICSTDKLIYSGRVKYSNQLVVQQRRLYSSPEDIYFGVFCSFKSYHNLNVLGVPVRSVSETEVGQDITPFLTFSVKTQLRQTIDEDTVFRVGDKVHFHLFLDTDDGYSAMRVEYCTLSSSPQLTDNGASTLPVIRDGCPAEGQTFLNNDNTWYRVQGQMNELETGLVQLIKLQQGSSLNLHCTIKLCLHGSEAACLPMECSSNAKRKRRNIETGQESEFVHIHGQLKLDEESEIHSEFDSMELAAIISTVLLTLTMIIVAVCVLLRAKPKRYWKHFETSLPTPDPLETLSANYIAGLRLDDPITITESNL